MGHFQAALDSVVDSDLATGYFPFAAPPAGTKLHNRRVLEATLLLGIYTRAASLAEKGKKSWKRLPEYMLADRLLALFNADWRIRQLQHFCKGSQSVRRGLCIDSSGTAPLTALLKVTSGLF